MTKEKLYDPELKLVFNDVLGNKDVLDFEYYVPSGDKMILTASQTGALSLVNPNEFMKS